MLLKGIMHIFTEPSNFLEAADNYGLALKKGTNHMQIAIKTHPKRL